MGARSRGARVGAGGGRATDQLAFSRWPSASDDRCTPWPQQRRGRDAERVGEGGDGAERHVDFPAFDALSVGEIESGELRQVFLGEAASAAKALHVAAEVAHDLASATAGWGSHARRAIDRTNSADEGI